MRAENHNTSKETATVSSKINVLALVLSLLAAAAAGCGYGFQGSGSVLPEDVQTISIKIAENNTTEPGLGLRFTEKLRSRFDRYGAVKVVDPDQEADAELITSIKGLENEVRDVTGATDIALELELIVSIRAELRMASGQILYRNDNLRVAETFGSVSDVVVTSSSQFAQGGIGSDTLSTLGSREVSRGQQNQAIEAALEEAARVLYLDAVAADF